MRHLVTVVAPEEVQFRIGCQFPSEEYSFSEDTDEIRLFSNKEMVEEFIFEGRGSYEGWSSHVEEIKEDKNPSEESIPQYIRPLFDEFESFADVYNYVDTVPAKFGIGKDESVLEYHDFCSIPDESRVDVFTAFNKEKLDEYVSEIRNKGGRIAFGGDFRPQNGSHPHGLVSADTVYVMTTSGEISEELLAILREALDWAEEFDIRETDSCGEVLRAWFD